MKTAIPQLAPMVLAIAIGCNGNPGAPTAPRAGSVGVTVGTDPTPPPQQSPKKTTARPVGPDPLFD